MQQQQRSLRPIPYKRNTTVPEIDIENFGHTVSKKVNQKQDTMKAKPKLIHPALHDIPQDLRYLIGGAINTVILMTSLMIANSTLKHLYSSSTIYTITNICFIPIGHALSSLLVFGWPTKYLQNLFMNAPISLIGTAIGTFCTEFFDRIEFDAACYRLLKSVNIVADREGEAGNMFTSVLVMIITGIWGYLLANYINSAPKDVKATKGDKEL